MVGAGGTRIVAFLLLVGDRLSTARGARFFIGLRFGGQSDLPLELGFVQIAALVGIAVAGFVSAVDSQPFVFPVVACVDGIFAGPFVLSLSQPQTRPLMEADVADDRTDSGLRHRGVWKFLVACCFDERFVRGAAGFCFVDFVSRPAGRPRFSFAFCTGRDPFCRSAVGLSSASSAKRSDLGATTG